MPTLFFIVSPHIPFFFFCLRNHKHFQDIVQMFLVTSLSCQGQIKEPGFTGDKIEVILQVTCFLNYWEVASGLQPLLWLAELIFVEKKKGHLKKYFNFPSTMEKEMTRKALSSPFQRVMLGGFSPVYLSVTLILFWCEWGLMLQEWVRKKK